MSTDQLSSRNGPQLGERAKLVQYDEYIDTKVESTRRLVKIVDLSTSLVVLAAGVLAFLLVAAVVEHWLLPGGFPLGLRIAFFALLLGGVGYFTYRRLWPLLIHRVNPVYAAQAIELSAATGLKNSLINLLLFRQKRSEIPDAVYQTLEEQAAQRLSRVPVEGAVDRSTLIRFGYVLVAVVAVAALYKMLSPKDPVVTARRVLMPWADIVPASRVNISDIRPGTLTVSRGEHIDVTAEVEGIGDNDSVLLRFTTEDGQAVDKSIVMKPYSDGLRFEGRLPDSADAANDVGLSQTLSYRIEAGDARSLDYTVKVIEAPSILVERVEYDYPAYTGYVDRHVDGLGDIRAIEGTRITITARANGPVKEAAVDFDADGRRDLRMTHNGEGAKASFELSLREDRQTPTHASYVLRFTNTQGQPNRNPVKHSIGVEPDYGPETSIRLPKEKSLDVRLDETISIEVEANDPDFALSEVRLHGEVAGREVIDEPLLARKHTGRFTGRYAFTATKHELKAGDVVEYWVTTNDNRTPEPNSAESEHHTLRITSPDPAQPPPDRIAQRDPQQNQQPGEQQQQEVAGGEGEQQGQQQPGAEGGQGQQGENQQPQNGEQGEQGQQGQQSGEQEANDDARQGEQQGQGEGQGGKETGRQGESDSQGEREQNAQSEQGQGGEQNKPGAQGQQSNDGADGAKPGEQSSNGKQTGAGAAGGESSQDSQPDGTRQPDNPGAEAARPDGNRGERPRNGPQNGNEQVPNAEQAPVSSEGDNDAEAFERIHRHMERDGDLKEGDAEGAEEKQEAGQAGKETGRQGEERKDNESKNDAAREGQEQAGQSAEERGEGTGAETKGDDLEQSQEQRGEQGDETKSPGGQQTSTKGEPGAGDEQQPQGAPNSQPEMKPTEKREQAPSQGEQSNKEEPPAGARGKRESDSQGDEGGDRAGGGEEGGGQKAPREGTGSAGQNQSADEGAGESSEQGTGNNSPNAGQDAKANDRTGQSSGETPGRGSKVRDGQGEQEGGKEGQGDKETGRQGEGDSAAQGEQAESGDQPSDRDAQPGGEGDQSTTDGEQQRNGRGTPTGDGGDQGTAAARPPQTEGSVPDGDEANLDYARKQTDLVLEKLADQLERDKLDEKLLDELGWSKDDLRKFVERWQSRKRASERNDESGDIAKRELDEALRSLGLRRGAMRQGPVKEDTMRDLGQGYRGAVPVEYQERLRAYNQGVSRAQPAKE